MVMNVILKLSAMQTQSFNICYQTNLLLLAITNYVNFTLEKAMKTQRGGVML